jgi:hypothetical protein
MAKPSPRPGRLVPWDEVTTFVCYYGQFEPDMGLFDVAILEPNNLTPDRMAWLRSRGTYSIAYISVGEDHFLREGDGLGPGGYASFYMERNGEPARNNNWNSYFVDAGNPLWQEIVLQRAREIIEMGCDGFFLDTIDTVDVFRSTREGMVSLIRLLHETFPDAKIVANRGFTLLPDFAPYITGLMFESFTQGYDFANREYKRYTGGDRQWIDNQAKMINGIREEHYFPVFALDYADPQDLESIQYCYDRAWEFDFIPSMSTIMLNRIYWHGVTPQSVRGSTSGLSRWEQ